MKEISKQTVEEKSASVALANKLNAALQAQINFNNSRKDALEASLQAE